MEEFEKNFGEEEQNMKCLTFDIIDNTNNNNNNNNSNIHNDELRESLLEHNQTPFCSKYRNDLWYQGQRQLPSRHYNIRKWFAVGFH